MADLPVNSKIKTVFISYCHEDEDYKMKLDSHLSSLKKGGIIRIWHDRQILAGKNWDKIIKKELEESDLILLVCKTNCTKI